MTCQILLQRSGDNGYKATPLAFLDCVGMGETRDEALANLKAAITEQLVQGEIVTVEVEEPEHPWLKWFGTWKEDPTYDDFVAEIEAYRREIDGAENNRADLSSGY